MLVAMVRTTSLDEPALADRLRQQCDVISREQALECGMTVSALWHRVRPGGRWRTIVPGVYLSYDGAPTVAQREMAALLHAGPGSVITGASALVRHGVRVPAQDTVDVLVPASRIRRASGFVRVLRTVRMPERTWVDGALVYAMPARAVADTARSLADIGPVRAVVAAAVQRGACTVGGLAEELTAGPVRGSALLRQVLAEVTEGVRSTAEGELKDLVKAESLPPPMFNAKLYDADAFVAMPDAWWPDAGVAVEVDSREWHLSPHDWQRTMTRHTTMSARGIIVLHFTPRQVRDEPGSVVSAIRSALDAGRARPPLGIRTVAA